MTLRECFDKHVSKYDEDVFTDFFSRRKLSWDIIWTMIENKDWTTSTRYDFDFDWGEICVVYEPEKEDDFWIWFVGRRKLR